MKIASCLADHEPPTICRKDQCLTRDTFSLKSGARCLGNSIGLARSTHGEEARTGTRPARSTCAALDQRLQQRWRLWEQLRSIRLVQPIIRRFLAQEPMVSEAGDKHSHAPDIEHRVFTVNGLRKCLASALGRQSPLWDNDNEFNVGIQWETYDPDLPPNH